MRMPKYLLFPLLPALLALTAGAPQGHAAVPWLMSYHGYLEDAPGKPMTREVALTFTLFDQPQGGEPLWSEAHPEVPVKNGFYKVTLGTVTPLDLPFDKPYFVAITIGSDPPLPRREPLLSLGGGPPPEPPAEEAPKTGNGAIKATGTGSNLLEGLGEGLTAALAGIEGIEARQQERSLFFVLPSDIFFAGAATTLKPGARETAARIGKALQDYPETEIALAVHTDTIGTYVFCKQVSRERARELQEALAAAGVSPARIIAEGFGEGQPVADNGFEWGRRLNRRVEMTIKPKL